MKGIEDAIKIFYEIRKKVPGAQFWVVGSGGESYVAKLHTLIKELQLKSVITFFGYVNEKKKIELYQKAHFLLHTSVREGFGLVVIEANSQGTPVLAYDSPGLKDIVKNGVNGYLFKKRSLNEIVRTCVSLYNNESIYQSLVKLSINESKKYNWKNITKQSFTYIGSIK